MGIERTSACDKFTEELLDRIVTMKDIIGIVNLSKQRIHQLSEAGKFPKPIKVLSRKVVLYDKNDITEWQEWYKENRYHKAEYLAKTPVFPSSRSYNNGRGLLSEKEKKCLETSTKYKTKQASEICNITPMTFRHILNSAYKKLGVNNKEDAILKAQALGEIEK